MDISKKDYNSLKKLVELFSNSTETELEALIWGDTFRNYQLFHNNFMNVINYFIHTLKISYKNEYRLNIITSSSNIRTTIVGIDNIKLYWLRNDMEEVNPIYIRKRVKDKFEMSDYGIRFNFKDEITKISPESKNINNSRLLDKNELKNYRYKNNISFIYEEFRIDFSTVKQCSGKSFRNSGCLKTSNTYEIEVELLDRNKDVKEISDKFLEIISMIIVLLQGGTDIISSTESNIVLSNYKKLTKAGMNNKKRNLFIAANAVSISKKNLSESKNVISIRNSYAVTYKADGIRHFLYIGPKGTCTLIDANMIVKNIDTEISGWNETLIEGEFLEELNSFLMYDILFAKGDDVRKRHLNVSVKEKQKKSRKLSRVELLQNFMKDVKCETLMINLKEYKYGNGEKIFEEAKLLLENSENLDYEIDGLIFTPIKEYYPTKPGTWNSLFKWKPPSHNSIDFLIRFKKNDQGKDLILPYFQNNIIKSTVKNYKILILNVSKNADRYNKSNKKWIKKVIPGEFNPEPENEGKYAYAKCFTEPNGKVYTIDPVTQKKDEIRDDTIVEFTYDKSKKDFKWNPIRVRYDKTEKYKSGKPIYGNFETVANDIWGKIMNPVTKYMIITGDVPVENNKNNKYYSNTNLKKFNNSNRLAFQRFHNQYVKATLIESVSPGAGGKKYIGELLDLSAGRGGDLPKWKYAKLKRIIGIDIDKAGIRYAMSFYKAYPKPKPNVYYVWGDSSKLIFPNYDTGLDDMSKLRLQEYISNKYSFDIVSIQFSLHYFFDDEQRIRNVLQNVSDNLKVGGHFIGTCFDGERVFEALKKNKTIDGKYGDEILWSITKKYRIRTFKLSKPNLGQRIEVYVKSIGNPHEEFLVNFSYLEKLCKEYNLELVKISSFKELYDQMMQLNNKKFELPDYEKEFSFLNSSFKFVKK